MLVNNTIVFTLCQYCSKYSIYTSHLILTTTRLLRQYIITILIYVTETQKVKLLSEGLSACLHSGGVSMVVQS